MKSCSTFQSGYNDTGIFGIVACADGSKGEEMVAVVIAELQAVSAKGSISDIELKRAKNVRNLTHLRAPSTLFLNVLHQFTISASSSHAPRTCVTYLFITIIIIIIIIIIL
jgi:hypothetical protein